MENGMPKYNNNKYINKSMSKPSNGNKLNYRYNDSRSIRNLRTEPNDSYYLNTSKITSKSFINSPFPPRSIHPRKNSFLSIYTENTVNTTSNIIYKLQHTLQLTERIKKKYLNKNKSVNYKKHTLKKKRISNKENNYNNGNIDNGFKTSIRRNKNKKIIKVEMEMI